MNMRIFGLSTIVAAALALGVASASAAEETRRVVVIEFAGPEPSAQAVHEAVVRIVADFYEVIPYAKYRVASRRMDIADNSMKSVSMVARKVGADAIVEGQLAGRSLTISVREGKTGRVIDRFKVTVPGRGISEGTREQIIDELVDLIDWTEPLKGKKEDNLPGDADPEDDGEDGDGRGTTRASFASDVKAAPPAPAAAPLAAVPAGVVPADATVTAEDPDKPKTPPRPSPIVVQMAVGAAASSRQLRYAQRPDLLDEQKPVAMSGSPSPAVVVAGIFEILPLGVSANVDYKRTIGASVGINQGGVPRKLSVAQSELGGGLSFRRKTGKRVTLRGGAGYRQLSFTIANKPSEFRMSDVRYAFLDASGGIRFTLRDERLALTADVHYLHVLGSSGITDKTVFGSATFQGYGAEAGFEVQTTDTTFVRVSASYEQLNLSFRGDGAWSMSQAGFKDVSGASDTFIDLAVLLGFRL